MHLIRSRVASFRSFKINHYPDYSSLPGSKLFTKQIEYFKNSSLFEGRKHLHSEYKTLVEIQIAASKLYNNKPFIGNRKQGNTVEFEWTTFKEFGDYVEKFRSILYHKYGITEGDKVAVISSNRLEWGIGAYAAFSLGAHYVPMYEAQNPKDWEHILRDSEAKILLVSSEAVHQKVATHIIGKVPNFPDDSKLLCFEFPEDNPKSFFHLLRKGPIPPSVPPFIPKEDTVATLIYTSGTTGAPKGVMLSHVNITSNIAGVSERFSKYYNSSSKILSFLPWAHIFGQTAEFHCGLAQGIKIACSKSTRQLTEELKVAKPNVLLGVPHVYNRVYNGVQSQMASSPIKLRLFNYAMSVAQKRHQLIDEGKSSLVTDLQYSLVDKLILSKIREIFGGELKLSISGGAALSAEIQSFFNRIGIPLLEGYGLTETSPIIATSLYGITKKQQGGLRALPGVEMAIFSTVNNNRLAHDEEGEICCSGPNIMLGYYKLPDQTKEVIFELDNKRWFRTGDLGRIDQEGILRITGRVKEQYKLSNGKFVVPGQVEDILKLSKYISNVFIYGDNLPYNVALIVPNFDEIRHWIKEKNLKELEKLEPANLVENEQIRKLIEFEIDLTKSRMKRYEFPRAFKLLSQEFSIDNDLLTPKLSLKRKNITKQYQEDLKKLYGIPVHLQLSYHNIKTE